MSLNWLASLASPYRSKAMKTMDGKYEIVKGKCVVCGEYGDCIDLGYGLMCGKDAKLLNDIAKVINDKNGK